MTPLTNKSAQNIARKSPMFKAMLAVALILVLAIAGYLGWQKFHERDKELDQYLTSIVQRGDIEDLVTATGTMQPRDYVDVGAQVSGQLKKIHVEVGSVVKAGDLLGEIDPTVYLATVDGRRASLKNQQATLRDRESQLTLAQLQLTRQKNLFAGDATTKELLQSAEASVRSATAQMEALKAQIEQTESSLRSDEASLNYAKIVAPISGVVVSIAARQGQSLNATQQSPNVLRIADLSTVTVQTQVSEADVSLLRPDMDVYFTTLGSRGKRWFSTLRKVEPTPTVNNGVVLYNALFDVSNTQRTLLPQMSAQVFFVAATAKDTLIVPASAVTVRRGSGGGKRERGDKSAPNAASNNELGAAGSSSAISSNSTKSNSAPASVPSDANSHPQKSSENGEPVAERQHRDRSGNRESGGGDDAAREARRAAFMKMTPEERHAARERFGKQGRSQPEQSDSSQQRHEEKSTLNSSKSKKTPPIKSPDNTELTIRPDERANAKPPERVIWASSGTQRSSAPKEATVRVIKENGDIEERKVQIGITNRVQVQILSGLVEGDKVITGIKQQAKDGKDAKDSKTQKNSVLQSQGGNQGGQFGAQGGNRGR